MLEELVRIGVDIATHRDPLTLGERIVEYARRLARAETGLLFLREQPHIRLAVTQGRGADMDLMADGAQSPVARVAASGSLLNMADLEGGIHSALVVPLSERRGDVIGVLALLNARDGDGRAIPFDAACEARMGVLARHAAAALENARVGRHADKLIVLSGLSRAMMSARDSREACLTIAEAATKLLGAVSTRVWADDPDERVVRAPPSAGFDHEIASVSVLAYGRGLVGRIAETHVPEYVRDVARDPRWLNRRLAESGRVHAFAGVPLVTGHRVIGVLSLLFGEPRDFGPEDRQLIELLADHAAIALENAHSYEAAHEQLTTTRALLAVARALSGRAPLEEMMRRVGREVARAIGADAVGAYFLDAQKEALIPVAGYRLPKDLLDLFRRTSLVLARAPGLQAAMREQRVVWSGDGGHDPRFDREAYGDIPAHSALFAPTVARGEAIGGLYIAWWRTGRDFLPAELRLVEGVAAQVGLALENVDLARQTEAKLRETETLLSVSRALSSTLDLQSLLRHFLRRVAQALDADAVGSYLLNDDGEWLEPLQGYRLPAEHLEGLRRLRLSIRRYPFYVEGAHTKRPVFSRLVAEDPRIPPIVRESFPHQSQLFVPIVAKDRVIGGLVAVWWRRGHDFSNGDLALIETIATQAGVALENARLFDENRRQVKELSALHTLSRAVTGELDRRTLIEALHAQVAQVFDARDLVILLRGTAEGEVVVALRVRDGERESAAFERCPADRAGLAAEVIASGLPLRTGDYAAECGRRGVVDPSPPAPRHWLGVPMTAGDTVLGVVALASAERAFTEPDERLLANIARLGALALRIARLFEERESAYSELYLLSLITHRALRRWHDGSEPAR